MRDTFDGRGKDFNIFLFNGYTTFCKMVCHWRIPVFMFPEANDDMSVSLSDIAHLTARTCDLINHITSKGPFNGWF